MPLTTTMPWTQAQAQAVNHHHAVNLNPTGKTLSNPTGKTQAQAENQQKTQAQVENQQKTQAQVENQQKTQPAKTTTSRSASPNHHAQATESTPRKPKEKREHIEKKGRERKNRCKWEERKKIKAIYSYRRQIQKWFF